jgi:signal transduction histidine kinase/ActR/RegA family two-component response regulator
VHQDGERLLRERQVLSRAARLLASAAGFEDSLRQTLAACLPALGDFGFFDIIVGEVEVRRTVAAHEAPDIEALLAPTQWVRQAHPELNLCALSTGEEALHPEIGEAWYAQVAANEQHLDLLRTLAFRSMITVPVRYRDELVGALTLFMGRSGRRHTGQDLAFAQELALLAAPLVVTARLLEQQNVQAERLRQARQQLELLATAGAQLARSLDPEDTLRAIAAIIVPGIADWCRIDLLDDKGQLQRRLAYHSDPERARRALDMAKVMRAATTTVGSMAWCVANGRSHFGRFDEPPASEDPALRLYTDTFQMRAHFMLPLVARGRTIGAMGVLQAESGRELSESDRALIQELGQRAALALDNARAYAEAEAARRQAESASRAKDEFLAMLGHELRNPLAPIATALELMARRESHAHVEERRIIGRQVAHLSRLIDDLLDVSRITQGKIELKRAPVDLRTVVAHALEQTQPLFERRERPVQVDAGGQPAMVQGDAMRLTQVVCNLLINAAKFTPPEREVRLALHRKDGWAAISVEDEGCGIAPHLLPRIFDLFVQGQQALDRQSGGLGLGLAIVRKLVEMHGGEVGVASEGEGKGCRFEVRLPLVAQSAAASPASGDASCEIPGAAGTRLMIVDDNTDAAETLADLLRVMEFEVRCAGDAEAAVALARSFRPRIALLDIGLPGQDGYELAARLRADPAHAGIQLVALTGYGRDNDRERAMAARFDEHLVKPAAADRLFAVLRELLAVRTA